MYHHLPRYKLNYQNQRPTKRNKDTPKGSKDVVDTSNKTGTKYVHEGEEYDNR